jgi:hypothetical protein
LILGGLRSTDEVLLRLKQLPEAPSASVTEVERFLHDRNLYATGIGYVDAHLLASALLAPGTLIWTRDRRLSAVATDLGVAG